MKFHPLSSTRRTGSPRRTRSAQPRRSHHDDAQRRSPRPKIAIALTIAIAAAAPAATDPDPAAASPSTILGKANQIGKASKQRGFAPRGLHAGKVSLALADVDGTNPNTFFNRTLHGDGGAAVPRFQSTLHNPSNAQWQSPHIYPLASDARSDYADSSTWKPVYRVPASPDNPRSAVMRVKQQATDLRPANKYYAESPGAELTNLGTAANGVFLARVLKRTNQTLNHAFYAELDGLHPMMPTDLEVGDVFTAALEGLAARGRALNVQDGIWQAKGVMIQGRSFDFRYDVTHGSDGSEIVNDFWPIYDNTTVPTVIGSGQRQSVESWATAVGGRHPNTRSLRTEDREDSIVALRDGAAAAEQHPSTVSTEHAVDPARQPGAAFVGPGKSARVQLITNKDAARPAKKAVPAATERRMYLVDDSSPTGVVKWEITGVAPDRSEQDLGTSFSYPSAWTFAETAAAINAAVSAPSATIALGDDHEARYGYWSGVWSVVEYDAHDGLVLRAAPVDPARYAGQGAKWKPTL